MLRGNQTIFELQNKNSTITNIMLVFIILWLLLWIWGLLISEDLPKQLFRFCEKKRFNIDKYRLYKKTDSYLENDIIIDVINNKSNINYITNIDVINSVI